MYLTHCKAQFIWKMWRMVMQSRGALSYNKTLYFHTNMHRLFNRTSIEPFYIFKHINSPNAFHKPKILIRKLYFQSFTVILELIAISNIKNYLI